MPEFARIVSAMLQEQRSPQSRLISHNVDWGAHLLLWLPRSLWQGKRELENLEGYSYSQAWKWLTQLPPTCCELKPSHSLTSRGTGNGGEEECWIITNSHSPGTRMCTCYGPSEGKGKMSLSPFMRQGDG